ncbi:probable Clb1-B-type cyclin 1 (fragment) [Sporisorium scitamineum]|uniref:Probable Clb1-B-type cyclin 1 n=1 Tax=Sporisorium scitamineum TaxID=49012 RepID=A0A0F7S967_9BASI
MPHKQQDLDAEDAKEPLMVAKYVNDIFEYMKELEILNMPNGDYMLTQKEINWDKHTILVDWLIDVHTKFHHPFLTLASSSLITSMSYHPDSFVASPMALQHQFAIATHNDTQARHSHQNSIRNGSSSSSDEARMAATIAP